MRVLVTRPREDAQSFAARLAAAGHEPLIDPVMVIRPHPEALPPLEDIGALVFTSANGVRAFATATPARRFAVFAVGAASAEAARIAGFSRVIAADGDTASLARRIAAARPAGKLLHIAGSVVAGDLQGLLAREGIGLARAVLYEAEPAKALAPRTRASLAPDAAAPLEAVTFFSPRTARLFARLLGEAHLSPERLAAVCLGPAVAEAAAELPYANVTASSEASEEAMIAALRAL